MPDPVTLCVHAPGIRWDVIAGWHEATPAEVLAHPAAAERIAALEAELETERLRLAACGVAAMQDTPTSVKERLPPGHPYYSGSYADVCRAVDNLMRLQAVLDAERGVRGASDDWLFADIGWLNERAGWRVAPLGRGTWAAWKRWSADADAALGWRDTALEMMEAADRAPVAGGEGTP